MHIPRKTRTQLSEFYAIAEDREESYIFPCVLSNMSETGALFVVEGDLGIRERIVACPVEEEVESLPVLDDIRNHPKRLSGVVIRRSGNCYGVRFDKPLDSEGVANGKGSLIDVKEDGLILTIQVQGPQDVESTARLQDTLRAKAGSSLFLLLDFSGVTKFPPTMVSFLKPSVKKIIEEARCVAVINSRVLGNRFITECPDSPYLKHCTFEAEALKFFSDRPIRVLVVEDEEITRVLIVKSLEKMKLTVIAVETGEEGVRVAAEQRPALILMDIHLPGIDGLEAAGQIRMDPSTRSIPIIMLTSDGEEDFVKRGLEIPVDDYVLKPFKVETIRKRITSTLLRKRR